MAHPPMDNGDYFMRAQRAAQQQAAALQNAYNAYRQSSLSDYGMMVNGPRQLRADPPMAGTPGERSEPEDMTGLRLLEEFLTKRRSARDGKADD